MEWNSYLFLLFCSLCFVPSNSTFFVSFQSSYVFPTFLFYALAIRLVSSIFHLLMSFSAFFLTVFPLIACFSKFQSIFSRFLDFHSIVSPPFMISPLTPFSSYAFSPFTLAAFALYPFAIGFCLDIFRIFAFFHSLVAFLSAQKALSIQFQKKNHRKCHLTKISANHKIAASISHAPFSTNTFHLNHSICSLSRNILAFGIFHFITHSTE